MLRFFAKCFLKPRLLSSTKITVRNYTPRRALLYVPGDDSKKISKAFGLDVDCITLDCEDGVAWNRKVQARLNIRDILDKGKPEKKRKYDLVVRVNSASSGLLKDDLSVISTGNYLPDTIFLPKVDIVDDLKMFSDYLNEYMKKSTKVGLIIGIETALSLVNVVDICKTAQKMGEFAKLTPVALLFGGDDFCASIGARKTESSFELTYARQKVVAVAKAFNLQAIDIVYIKFKDDKGLMKQAEEGAQMGFTGKQVIHPRQVEITQTAFLPTKEEIQWATGVMQAFHKHQKEGQGAFTYKGSMIDVPTMKQAQNVLDMVNAVTIQ